MKMKMKMKNESHRYDINRSRPRHGHKQHLKLNTQAELKKSVAYKKSMYNIESNLFDF